MADAARPVIVGVAQRTWRDRDVARTPVEGLVDSARAALADASCDALAASIDCVATVPYLASQMPELATLFGRNTASALAERLSLAPRELITSDYGGHLPQWFANRCADALVAGEYRAVLISGCELMATLFAALRNGQDLAHWQIEGERESRDLGRGLPPCLPLEQAHGLFEPINTYPLFQSALRHARGWSSAEQDERLAALTARMSTVAAENPLAWRREALEPAQALSTGDGNRMITAPYRKAMNAILAVDMAASVVMTTDQEARRLGIPEARWVYLTAGAEANDVQYTLQREAFHGSPALSACVREALAMGDIDVPDLAAFDLYSCFPSAVEVACDALGIDIGDPRPLTVTGGLTRFGGPGNNYSLHAIAQMCEQLRAGGSQHGLVTANGGYLTKHAVGVYSTQPGANAWSERDTARSQAAVDGLAYPQVAESPSAGTMHVEAHAVPYRDGEPAHAIVVGRLEDGRRSVALAVDPSSIQTLLEDDCVGRQGSFEPGEPVNRFSLR
jgi:acetyl-CoA C-acetyltransferase